MKNNIFRLLRYDLPLHFILFLTNWLPDLIIFIRFRGYLAHFFFKQCGKDLRLGRNITFYNPSNIYLGDHIYIAYGNWFSAGDKIVIDNEVLIGPYNVFTSSSYTKIRNSFRYGKHKRGDIHIQNGSWITSHCTITMGVKIGEGCLVAANSTVISNIKNGSLVGGSPAVKIKDI